MGSINLCLYCENTKVSWCAVSAPLQIPWPACQTTSNWLKPRVTVHACATKTHFSSQYSALNLILPPNEEQYSLDIQIAFFFLICIPNKWGHPLRAQIMRTILLFIQSAAVLCYLGMGAGGMLVEEMMIGIWIGNQSEKSITNWKPTLSPITCLHGGIKWQHHASYHS